MSKLAALRHWFTIETAAKTLADRLGEPVVAADVLRLGLDGYLTLSVLFKDIVLAREGKVVPRADARMLQIPDPEHLKSLAHQKLPIGEVPMIQILEGHPLPPDGERIFEPDDTDVRVTGIWDVPMMGPARLDVEQAFYLASGMAPHRLVNLDSLLLFTPSGDWIELRERFDDEPGSGTYPAGTLPACSEFVVRADALEQFLDTQRVGKPHVEAADGSYPGGGQWWEKVFDIPQVAKDICDQRRSVGKRLSQRAIANELASRIGQIARHRGADKRISPDSIRKAYGKTWPKK